LLGGPRSDPGSHSYQASKSHRAINCLVALFRIGCFSVQLLWL